MYGKLFQSKNLIVFVGYTRCNIWTNIARHARHLWDKNKSYYPGHCSQSCRIGHRSFFIRLAAGQVPKMEIFHSLWMHMSFGSLYSHIASHDIHMGFFHGVDCLQFCLWRIRYRGKCIMLGHLERRIRAIPSQHSLQFCGKVPMLHLQFLGW